LLVTRLNCQWSPTKWKATSGISVVPLAFTSFTVPRMRVSVVIEPQQPLGKTAFASAIGLPLASHTVNFTGMVLSLLLLNTLLPSVLMGGKMTPPGGFGPEQLP